MLLYEDKRKTKSKVYGIILWYVRKSYREFVQEAVLRNNLDDWNLLLNIEI